MCLETPGKTVGREAFDRAGRWRVHVRAWLGALLGVHAALACADPGFTLEEVQSRGFLRAAYVDEPPYAFRDSTGTVTGEAPEALRAAARHLGISEIRWIRLDFGDLLPALELGRVDVIAAGLFRTAAREHRVGFTRPTACGGPVLVVRSEAGPRDILDVASDTFRVALLTGSMEQTAVAHLGVPPERVLPVPDVRTAFAALREGKVAAVAITEPTARHATRATGFGNLSLRPYQPPTVVADLLGACSALAFRPRDGALRAAVDSVLAVVLESPEHRALLQRLGFRASVGASIDDAKGY